MNNNSNYNNPNRSPLRKKRRWYYQSPPPLPPPPPPPQPPPQPPSSLHSHDSKPMKHVPQAPQAPPPPPSRQDTLHQHEKERIENEKQVLKMEQQLHQYFHKSNTPYSYVDDNGIYKFTPSQGTSNMSAIPVTSGATSGSGSGAASTNPFMNMTFTPFTPASPFIPNLWTTLFPFQVNPIQTNPFAPAPAPAPVLPEPEFIEIRENIQHIDDLIALCDKYPLSDTKKYNINMSAIHAIREPLGDLSNMIGMDTIKKTIVDQILYYLQELHVPEVKSKPATLEDKDNDKDKDKDEAKDEAKDKDKDNDDDDDDDAPLKANTKPVFNPFVQSAPPSSFAGFQASASLEFKPMSIKIPPWTPSTVSGIDNFALPTKGDFMHTVIYGPPGSGKTEVAKIIGRIFCNLGILNKKIFKKVSRNDLVAGYLGQTAIKTKDMIKASLGGVLFIDEAYSLGNSEKRDSFAKECVDTLCEALSEHKHNWMVIIAGYEKELNDCFFSLNEGLNSRFTWRFKLDAYKPGELKSIYKKQVYDYGWTIAAQDAAAATVETDRLPDSWFASRMDYFTTYGRDMETLFTKTKIAHSRRVFCLPACDKKIITLDDLENGFKLFIENPEVKDRKERGIGPYMKTLYL